MGTVNIGTDLGQQHDPSAVVVCELQRRGDGRHYVARHVERLPLGTSYPAVVRRLVEIEGNLKAQGHEIRHRVDATGLGKPVIDLMRDAGLRPQAVYLTGSDTATETEAELRLGKALLVSRLQVLLQTKCIHLPDTPESAALVDELLTYEIKVNDNAHAQFGAFKTGKHDDLATALGLACWAGVRKKRAGWGWGTSKDKRGAGGEVFPGLPDGATVTVRHPMSRKD